MQYLERENGGGDGRERHRGGGKGRQRGEENERGRRRGREEMEGEGGQREEKNKEIPAIYIGIASSKRKDGRREGEKVVRLGGRLG